MSTLDEQAIHAALSGRWQDAVALNQQIVEKEELNLDALNRLAYAHAKCGDYKKACEIYQKVLKADSYNPLATKNLEKFKKYQNSPTNNHVTREVPLISPSLFLTDSEKTKTVNLINLASGDILQELAVGEEVYPMPKRFELHIKSVNNKYLGTLPDDIGHPLLKLLRNNSSCRFFVKDVADHQITVFIKY
jgi:tetratricopeptide (TPR) repeat protein